MLYLIKNLRPDLSNSIRELSKNMDKATESDLDSMFRVMKYIQKITVSNHDTKVRKIRILHTCNYCFAFSDFASPIHTIVLHTQI